ncbi:hypothetical protein [Aestuariimicrobium sp. T2.26MG-19.2B]|uniref:hypothetical protein n=1 Tax=Aestuariimicrobium sp. T2.26MG-19.2B TaxID=3040679 RepID=UPI0024776600|nr:hypothetical protein [Aestuariimicrobium sp. T2.26MG-19.2B]CAI9403558.1 hypothetical protein AESSP_01028 [Aestuariimicrobium sp. T2.26MG-19.2B]
MHAQLMIFDGPQSPELLAAAELADTQRIRPLIDANQRLRDDIVARYDLRQADGGRAILLVTGSESTLDLLAEVVMTSQLVPGEDPALLPGPSRVERYTVAEAFVAHRAGAR